MVVHLPAIFRVACRASLLALGAWILIASIGCEKRNKVTNPQTTPATLAQLWPNDDGRSWTFRGIARTWDPPAVTYYPTALEVPRVTFDTVAAVFASRPVGTHVVADTSMIQLRFNGTSAVAVSIQLPAGIPVQVLEETHMPVLVAATPPGSRARGWLADLAIARPDLRERLATSISSTPPTGPAGGFLGARFVHGGLWRLTAKWIGTHDPADTDTFPDWKFLEADLKPGMGFTMQLLPDLAPEVTLNARVARSLTVLTPYGYVAGGVEVHYYIDYGLFAARDDTGAFTGWGRNFTCGSVLYAPGVGPVRDDERGLLFAGASRRPGGGDLLLELTDGGPHTARFGGGVGARPR